MVALGPIGLEAEAAAMNGWMGRSAGRRRWSRAVDSGTTGGEAAGGSGGSGPYEWGRWRGDEGGYEVTMNEGTVAHGACRQRCDQLARLAWRWQACRV